MTKVLRYALQNADAPKCDFLFVLLPNFSQLSFTASVETISRTIEILGWPALSYKTCSADGGPVVSSLGMEFSVDQGPGVVGRETLVIVIGGNRHFPGFGYSLAPWLHRLDRGGNMIAALGSAVFLLARIGLLSCASVSVPWECSESFAEMFPQFEVSSRLITEGPRRLTCLGGIYSIDLILSIVSKRFGKNIADEVAQYSNYIHVRRLNKYTSTDRSFRLGVENIYLRNAIELMESNLEEKLSTDEIARQIGVSQRQLQRICKRELRTTPNRLYQKIQLEKAKCLLLETPLSVSEVALASGFNSLSNFSKNFRRQFGVSAHQIRQY